MTFKRLAAVAGDMGAALAVLFELEADGPEVLTVTLPFVGAGGVAPGVGPDAWRGLAPAPLNGGIA